MKWPTVFEEAVVTDSIQQGPRGGKEECLRWRVRALSSQSLPGEPHARGQDSCYKYSKDRETHTCQETVSLAKKKKLPHKNIRPSTLLDLRRLPFTLKCCLSHIFQRMPGTLSLNHQCECFIFCLPLQTTCNKPLASNSRY